MGASSISSSDTSNPWKKLHYDKGGVAAAAPLARPHPPPPRRTISPSPHLGRVDLHRELKQRTRDCPSTPLREMKQLQWILPCSPSSPPVLPSLRRRRNQSSPSPPPKSMAVELKQGKFAMEASACAGGKKRSELLEAAVDGDVRSFKKLATALDKGRGRLRDTVEGVRTENDEEMMRGLGALHLAAYNGNLDMCRYLVEVLRLDVDALDHRGRTPLIHAIHGEKANTSKYLLDQGANQDKTSHDGFTPLHCAAGSGCYKIVRQLLERGAYPDPVNGCGTPLHIVAAECDDRSMKILLDHNADYNKMVNGMTPLYFAINATSVKCVKLLVEAGGAVANGEYFLTAVRDAPPKSGSSECLMCVLGIGDNWNARNDSEPVDKRKIQELKSKGSKAVGRKDFLSAAEFYSMAMELDPDNATLFSNRSLCWLELGKPLLGLLDALECRKRRPDWPKALYRQSKALMSLKDYMGACEAFLEALKLDPGNAEIEDGLRNALVSLKVSRRSKAD
uniref:Uncharacterized protein n=1 Tax=Avena sativa TaxID=4498 RepID=A0ACD5XUL9_AVESA